MLFQTKEFLIFITIVYGLFWAVKSRHSLRLFVFLLSSVFFYGFGEPRFLLLLLWTVTLDFYLGLAIDRAESTRKRKILLQISLVSNLGVLGFFKYYNFFAENFANAFWFLHLKPESLMMSIALPMGISFYTFHSLSYIIDVYRKKISSCKNFLEYAVYVLFFPNLVAGPILRADYFLPVVKKDPIITESDFFKGIFLFSVGILKKVIVADWLGILFVDRVMKNPEQYSSLEVLLASYGYVFQIYNDFSGYSDMALGLGYLFGFQFPQNFNSPLLSQNIREYWTRWHISLSTWLRDYLFVSLDGGRRAALKNIFITMTLAGLWHGAKWTFVLWGAFHGAWVVVSHLYGKRFRHQKKTKLNFVRNVFITFNVLAISGILFRAESLIDATDIYKKLFSFSFYSVASEEKKFFLVLMLLAAIMHGLGYVGMKEKWAMKYVALPVMMRALVLATTVFLILSIGKTFTPFIYFQF